MARRLPNVPRSSPDRFASDSCRGQPLETNRQTFGPCRAPRHHRNAPTLLHQPASKLRVAPRATSMLPTISPRPWVTLTVTGMVTCVFHAPVTFPREKRPLNLTMILSPSTPTEAAETKNVKGKSRPAPKRARAPIVFDRRFWTTPGIFDPPASMQQLPNAPPETAYETASLGLREISM